MTQARIAAQNARINYWGNKFVRGDNAMGQLVNACCSDSARGGSGYLDDDTAADMGTAAISSLVPGSGVTPAGTSSSPGGTSPATGTVPSYPLTPVDIITGTKGFPISRSGRPFPRPRSRSFMPTSAYPRYGPMYLADSMIPPCPCFGSGPPVTLPAPTVVTPVAAPPPSAPVVSAPSNCPYPGCSTGNVCLDLVTGCVSNSQVDPAQTEACALANYGVFGNNGAWLSAIMLGCGRNLPYIGTPLPNPPQAAGSMTAQLQAAVAAGAAASSKARGVSGLGQDDGSSNVGGFLAVIAMFGIVVWAMKK